MLIITLGGELLCTWITGPDRIPSDMGTRSMLSGEPSVDRFGSAAACPRERGYQRSAR
jgi:hypothetical protein